MIIVNVNTNADPASLEVRHAAAGEWVVDRTAIAKYGDGLLAVHEGRVVGAYVILSHSCRGQRTTFKIQESSRLGFLIGRPLFINPSVNSVDHAQFLDTDFLCNDAYRHTNVAYERGRRRTSPRVTATLARRHPHGPDRPRAFGDRSPKPA